MSYLRNVDFIAETLQAAKRSGRGCSLLIGAGCSVTAGIPTAGGFVTEIKERFPRRYAMAPAKTYPDCMAQLLEGERRDLIKEYVDSAKINWAHIGIALLLQQGYVDRVLTTNFDPLVVRAGALLGEFPAVYDLAASEHFKPADIPDKAVFYLHGQHTGFVLLNTSREVKQHSERLGPVFDDAARGRVWIVVGYSGENDPVFDHLARVKRFDHGLFWVGYRDAAPNRVVEQKLLTGRKNAFYTSGHDADSFFIALTQELKIFPPDIVSRPFTHLDNLLQMLTPFPLPKQASTQDVTRFPRKWIQSAIQRYEKRPKEAAVTAQQLLLKGDYEGVLAFQKDFDKAPSPELASLLFMAYSVQAGELALQAEGAESPDLFAEAAEKYRAALAIQPDSWEVRAALGYALARLAILWKEPSTWAQATEAYQAATEYAGDRHLPMVYDSWAAALLEYSRSRPEAERGSLVRQAQALYFKGEDLEPGRWAYELAGCSALLGDETACLAWLEKSLEFGSLPSQSHVAGDEAFQGVRQKEWFRAFRARAFAGSRTRRSSRR